MQFIESALFDKRNGQTDALVGKLRQKWPLFAQLSTSFEKIKEDFRSFRRVPLVFYIKIELILLIILINGNDWRSANS